MTRKFEFLTLSKLHARFARELLAAWKLGARDEMDYVNISSSSTDFITAVFVAIILRNMGNCIIATETCGFISTFSEAEWDPELLKSVVKPKFFNFQNF